MSKDEELRIEIDDDGNVSIEAFNYIGNECANDVDKIMKELEATDVTERKKKEYYLKERTTKINNKRK